MMLAILILVELVQEFSWFLSFGIASMSMALSIILFFMGSRNYVHVKPEGIKTFASIAKVGVMAYKKHRLKLHDD